MLIADGCSEGANMAIRWDKLSRFAGVSEVSRA
jgi:hypothetical protein